MGKGWALGGGGVERLGVAPSLGEREPVTPFTLPLFAPAYGRRADTGGSPRGATTSGVGTRSGGEAWAWAQSIAERWVNHHTP